MRTRTRTIVAGLVLAAALVGGVAWATIPGTDGTIQGCYTTGNGNLRVVESADECRNSETAISWNEQGQAGAAGVDGRNGQDGAPGATGPKGDPGANGLDGAKGDKGDKGDPGETGANGVDGKDGANGRDGSDGLDGVDGQDGAAGPAGSPGPAGAACLATDPACIGPQGATGPQGPPGLKGDTGARGPAGPGSATFWAKIATSALDGIGVLNANSNLITATRLRTGSYRITFPYSLSYCAIVVTDAGGAWGWDAGAADHAALSIAVGHSYFGGTIHTNSLDIQVKSYGGQNQIYGALFDGATLNIVVFC